MLSQLFKKVVRFMTHEWSFFFTLGAFKNLRNATISIVMSVLLSAWANSAPSGRIFMKFDISIFFGKSVVKIQVSLKSGENNGYFT